MIEYIALLLWLISMSLCLIRKSPLLNIFGVLLVAVLSPMMYLNYSDVFGFSEFIVFASAMILYGSYNIMKQVL